MMLLAGTAIRFKGPNSDVNAAELADSLRGCASYHGSKVVITRTTRFKVKMYPSNGSNENPLIADHRSQIANLINLSAHRSNHE